MSGGMPELGSKISLISKADIRYEGRLFTVNPEECTIALANGKFKWKNANHYHFEIKNEMNLNGIKVMVNYKYG